ncbi:MAG: aromatic ring-opening dioxygenase LigA [Phenylobacterium zucineum]|nr:MAG: aromatic ring-opening dioxygenase LigA [Phenylobacterium zucineum]
MSNSPAGPAKKVRALGLVTIVIGLIFVVAGAVTWGMVSTKLAAEKITVSADAPMLAGAPVTGPIEAYIQADMINHHALAATDGKTYAELGKDDPLRQTAMTGSFLRASLFTSVIAFGVALFAVGVGVIAILIGWALRLTGASASPAAAAVQERVAAAE